MSVRYVLDTNILIYIINGDLKLEQIVGSGDFYITVPGVVYMELLSKDIGLEELSKIQDIVNSFEVSEAGLHEYMVGASLRRKYKALKSADAIIAATAKTKQAILVTSDALLLKITELSCTNPLSK